MIERDRHFAIFPADQHTLGVASARPNTACGPGFRSGGAFFVATSNRSNIMAGVLDASQESSEVSGVAA